MTKKLVLYGYMLCPYCQRVRFALEFLKVEYEYVEVDLYTEAQKLEKYLKINPTGQLPCLLVDEKVVSESMIIMEYLADEFGKVLPTDSYERSQQRIWAGYFDKNISSKFYELLHLCRSNSKEQIYKLLAIVVKSITYFTEKSGLQERINKNNHSYFIGTNQLSYIDFAILPNMRVFELFLKKILEIDIFNCFGESFVAVNERDQIILKSFKLYYENAKKSVEYISITDHLKVEHGQQAESEILKQYQEKSGEIFNYEDIFVLYMKKKYLN